jgi:hypothetical protein
MPTGIQTSRQQTLRLATNEVATCKWGVSPKEYDELPNTFQATGSTLHLQEITLQEGLNQYFMACSDLSGNKNTRTPVNLELNAPPTAKIHVTKDDKYSQLAAKTYALKLTTNEPVVPTPSLSISCQGQIISIPLEGSSTEWNGYLKIPDSSLECIAEFSYSAVDNKGVRGSEITDGKLSIISTSKPKTPYGLKAQSQDRKVVVSWSQPQEGIENVDHYNIYRSITGNTDQNNLAYTVQLTTHHDNQAQNNIGYFYKVAAVSKSGIESDLSKEAFVKTDFPEDDAHKLDPEIIELIDSKIKEFDALVSLAEEKVKEYIKATDKSKEIIELTGARSRMELAIENMKLSIGELKAYKNLQASLPDLEQRIGAITQKAEIDKNAVVAQIRMQLLDAREPRASELELTESVNEFLKTALVTDNQKKAYLAEAKQLQERARISKEIWAYELHYLGNNKESGFLVIEDLSIISTDLSDLTLQEWLPRSSTRLSELAFQEQPSDVNAAGPFWKMQSLSKRNIIYLKKSNAFSTALGAEDAPLANALTILLPKLETVLLKEAGTTSGLDTTGKVVAIDSGIKGTGWVLYVAMAFGLLTVILLVYYLRPDQGQNPRSEAVHEFQHDFKGLNVSGLENHVGSGAVQTLIEQARHELSKGDLHAAVVLYNSAKEARSASSIGLLAGFKSNYELNSLYEEILSRLL